MVMQFIESQDPVGYICLTPTYRIAVYRRKPLWIHRLAMLLFFGWGWEDHH